MALGGICRSVRIESLQVLFHDASVPHRYAQHREGEGSECEEGFHFSLFVCFIFLFLFPSDLKVHLRLGRCYCAPEQTPQHTPKMKSKPTKKCLHRAKGGRGKPGALHIVEPFDGFACGVEVLEDAHLAQVFFDHIRSVKSARRVQFRVDCAVPPAVRALRATRVTANHTSSIISHQITKHITYHLTSHHVTYVEKDKRRGNKRSAAQWKLMLHSQLAT